MIRTLLKKGGAPRSRLALTVLLGVASGLANVGLLAGSGYLLDRAVTRPGLGAIAGLLAAVEVLAFLRGPLRYAERLVSHDTALRALTHWRVWFYDILEPRSPAALHHLRRGDILSRATDGVDVLQDLYVRVMLPVAVTLTTVVGAVVIEAVIDPLCGVILAAGAAIAVVATPLIALVTSPTSGTLADRRAELSSRVVELVQGAPDLLAFGADAQFIEEIEDTGDAIAATARRRASGAGVCTAVVTVCAGVVIVAMLAVGIHSIHTGGIEPAMITVLPLTALAAFEPIMLLGNAALRALDVVAAGERLAEIEALPIPVTDPRTPIPLTTACPSIVFDHVHLRYAEHSPEVLRGFDLRVDPGRRVAITGASGSGKTSIVHLLLRFWPPTSGAVTIDGISVNTLSESDSRGHLSLVDQDAGLFAGSIRRNITLANPDADAAIVDEALRVAQLSSWVDTLPDGLDTPVGERGTRVSGGERRRIALARALVHGGRVLVLDEPTTGLDAETADRLHEDLKTAFDGRSVIVVTHDERDLEGCDTVMHIETGCSRVMPDAESTRRS